MPVLASVRSVAAWRSDRISSISSPNEPVSATAGQALTRAPTGRWPSPRAALAQRVATMPDPSHRRAGTGCGTPGRAGSQTARHDGLSPDQPRPGSHPLGLPQASAGHRFAGAGALAAGYLIHSLRRPRRSLVDLRLTAGLRRPF
jgi:hypothetical protein